MGIIKGPDRIGNLTESGGVITLAPSRLAIGGQQYKTDTIDVSPSGLSTERFYRVFAVQQSGAVQLVVSLNDNLNGPSGFNAWKLVGKFYSGLNSGINALFATDNEDSQQTVKATAYLGSNQSVGTNTLVKVNIDTVDSDEFNIVDTANNKIVIPRDGWYYVKGQIGTTNNDLDQDERIDCRLAADGSTFVVREGGAHDVGRAGVDCSKFKYFNKDQEIELYTNTGSDSSYTLGSGASSTFLEVIGFPDFTNLIE